MNQEQREMLHTLMMSETFARLSMSVKNVPKVDMDELMAMLAVSAVEVLKEMDAENIGYRTENAEMHHVSMMAIIFSYLFGGTENFANATHSTDSNPVWIN